MSAKLPNYCQKSRGGSTYDAMQKMLWVKKTDSDRWPSIRATLGAFTSGLGIDKARNSLNANLGYR